MEPQAATSLPAGPQATAAAPTAQSARETPLPKSMVRTAFFLASLLPIMLFIAIIVLMIATNYNFLNWME